MEALAQMRFELGLMRRSLMNTGHCFFGQMAESLQGELRHVVIHNAMVSENDDIIEARRNQQRRRHSQWLSHVHAQLLRRVGST